MSNVRICMKTSREMKEALKRAAGKEQRKRTEVECREANQLTLNVLCKIPCYRIHCFPCLPSDIFHFSNLYLYGSRLHPNWREKDNRRNSCSFTPKALRTRTSPTPARTPVTPRRRKLAPWRRCKNSSTS